MLVPLPAEPLAYLGALPITNAYVNSTLALLILCGFGWLIRRRISEVPSRLQAGVELLLEFLLGFFDQVTHDRKKSKRFLPFVGTLFLFILLSNWMGLLPGTGTIGLWKMEDGARVFIPFLRSANSDLNLTLAMALVSVVFSHLIGIFTIGLFVHLNKFIQLGSLWNAVKTLSPLKILTALVEFIVGFIELFSEIAKVVSLSLRLFGNIFAGEVLITVISGLVSVFVPLPFMALEVIVGIVQATVFAMLTLVYLTVATTAPHGASHEPSHPHDPVASHA